MGPPATVRPDCCADCRVAGACVWRRTAWTRCSSQRWRAMWTAVGQGVVHAAHSGSACKARTVHQGCARRQACARHQRAARRRPVGVFASLALCPRRPVNARPTRTVCPWCAWVVCVLRRPVPTACAMVLRVASTAAMRPGCVLLVVVAPGVCLGLGASAACVCRLVDVQPMCRAVTGCWTAARVMWIVVAWAVGLVRTTVCASRTRTVSQGLGVCTASARPAHRMCA